MRQYLTLLKDIQEKGVVKPPARSNMPGTKSLFGYQFRHDLRHGFPLLTTKEINFKHIVVELLWFLKGDTNIKYLVDNDVNIWNQDAYNYYLKVCKEDRQGNNSKDLHFLNFIDIIRIAKLKSQNGEYCLGDCGFQYGKVWRNWKRLPNLNSGILKLKANELSKEDHDELLKQFQNQSSGYYLSSEESSVETIYSSVDQIEKLINGLRNNPESRRHILTAIDPSNEDNLALYWCHALSQFNCRPIGDEVFQIAGVMYDDWEHSKDITKEELWAMGYPKYYLDCQMYQRSADVILGVPYNIASYALLTHILAEMCNMVPGEFIHTFGDVHIYDNHIEAVEEQLKREPRCLPYFSIHSEIRDHNVEDFDNWYPEMFKLTNYNPHAKISAKLSTGLK